MFTFAKKSLWQVPPTVEPPTPQQEPVDEERYPGYNSASFYPANPGEVLNHNLLYGLPETFQDLNGNMSK